MVEIIPLLDLKAQYLSIKSEIDSAMADVFNETAFILGKYVSTFENEMASYLGVKHAIGVANGTDALCLILRAMGLKAGDKVITTPFTFFATAEAICSVGATPVFVDIEPETYNIDPSKIEAAIDSSVKAIMPVHIFGQPANMDAITLLAEKYGLKIIEDACQAIGAKYKGRMVGKLGKLGDAAAFSFFPSKNLGCAGDGGMVVTDDDELAAEIKLLRQHGSSQKYMHKKLGVNSRLDGLQAAILSVKLKYIDQWNQARRRNAYKYNELLTGTNVKTPFEQEDLEHVYHLYILRSTERDVISKALDEAKIGNGVYYPLCLHLQEALKFLGYKEGDLPVAEAASKETFAIPLFPEMTDEQMREIVSVVKGTIS